MQISSFSIKWTKVKSHLKHLWAPATNLGMLKTNVCFWWVMINFELIRFFLLQNVCWTSYLGQYVIVKSSIFLNSSVQKSTVDLSIRLNFAKQLRFREKKIGKKILSPRKRDIFKPLVNCKNGIFIKHPNFRGCRSSRGFFFPLFSSFSHKIFIF